MNSSVQNFEAEYKDEINFLKEKGELINDWSNVYDHCFTEGLVADVLSDLLNLVPADRDTLVKVALLHDWFKRKEREAVNQQSADQYNAKAVESAERLKDFGYSSEIVELTKSVGHTSLTKILQSDNFLEKIMHYIDDITFGNNVVKLDERMDQLEMADRYKELNKSGEKIHNGKTYFEVQREVGHQIENEIAKRLQVEASAVVERVKQKIQKKYEMSV